MKTPVEMDATASHGDASRGSADPEVQPVIVYLDMNLWVGLTRGCVRHEARWESVRDGLSHAVADGRAVVPLSVAHYLELWHRRDQRSREQVGAMMRAISGYATIPAPHLIRRDEVRRHILRFMGRSAHRISADELLGHGAAHAFGSPHGRFRFVESLASTDGTTNEGPATAPPDDWNLLSREGDAWEWLQLVGAQQILESEGVDRTPEHRYGSVNQRDELKLREWLSQDSEAHRRLWDLLVTEEIKSLLDDINQYCEEFEIDPHGLFLSDGLGMTPPEAMRAFIADLPSANTWATLRLWKHRDLTHPWEQHDWTDISALSVAVPYCDVVLTERRWAHLIKASGLAGRYGTALGHGVSGIEAIIEGLR